MSTPECTDSQFFQVVFKNSNKIVKYKHNQKICTHNIRAYPSRAPEFTPLHFAWSVLLIFLGFCVVFAYVFTFWVPCCIVRYDVCMNTMSSSSLPPVVSRRARFYLRQLCLFVYGGVQHVLTIYSDMAGVLCRVGLSALPQCLGSHRGFGGVRVAHRFGFRCCVFGFFICLRSVSSVPGVAGFLNCQFLIAHLVFSNVY